MKKKILIVQPIHESGRTGVRRPLRRPRGLRSVGGDGHQGDKRGGGRRRPDGPLHAGDHRGGRRPQGHRPARGRRRHDRRQGGDRAGDRRRQHPEANAISVAEHTLTVIGALAKRVVVYDRAIRDRGLGDPQLLPGHRSRRQDPRPRGDRQDRIAGRPEGGGGLQHEGDRLRPLRHAGEGAGDGHHPRPGERRRLPAGGRGLAAHPADPGNAGLRQRGATRA